METEEGGQTSNKNLIGRIFNDWTVIEYDKNKSEKMHRPYWICRCALCGNTFSVNENNMIRGLSKRCFKCGKKVGAKKNIKNIAGNKYGKLFVECFIGIKKNVSQWQCLCECGNSVTCSERQLESGKKTSCGCDKQISNIVGKKYNLLTVVKRNDVVSNNGKKVISYDCQCDCGNMVNVRRSNLLSGQTKSCGCNKKTKPLDLQGMKFGEWYVLNRAENDKHNRTMWLCRCSCGTERKIAGTILASGESKSCGCMKGKFLSESNRKLCKYDLSGEYGIGFSNNGFEFKFDKEDYDKIKNFSWYFSNYLNAFDKANNKTITFGRIVMEENDEAILIDHINHNKLDNRKENLRRCSNKENQMNRRIGVNNTSGHKGVYFHKWSKKWRAFIYIDGKEKHLGNFNDISDAVRARENAEKKYFKEYNYSVDEDYAYE